MARKLKDNLNSRYFEAANRMGSKRSRRRIVAYVESYDDIYFWRTVLSDFEDDTRYFEVMLPSRVNLTKGKKQVLMNFIGKHVGRDMIACVDADYDYLLQGRTEISRTIINSPYVFHTYVYAIENYQCYAPALHNVAVMVTLNDHAIFDFEYYLAQYSAICFPLFVWSVMAYRDQEAYKEFSITDFNRIIDPGGFTLQNPDSSLKNLRRKVHTKISALQREHPNAKQDYLQTKADLIRLGVTPETTYLYIQGHHIFDTVVVPIMSKVCRQLQQERLREIHSKATHKTQMHNELSCYDHSRQDIRTMLKKSSGYEKSEPFRRLQADVQAFLDSQKDENEQKAEK